MEEQKKNEELEKNLGFERKEKIKIETSMSKIISERDETIEELLRRLANMKNSTEIIEKLRIEKEGLEKGNQEQSLASNQLIESLKTENDNLKKEKDELTLALNQVKEKVSTEVQRLKNESEQTRTMMEDLKKEKEKEVETIAQEKDSALAKVQQERNALARQKEQLEEQAKEKENQLDALRKEVEELKSRVEQLLAKNKDLETELENLKRAKDEPNAELETMRSALSDAKQQQNALKYELDSAKAQETKMSKQFKDTKEKLDQAKQEAQKVEMLEAEIKELKSNLADTYKALEEKTERSLEHSAQETSTVQSLTTEKEKFALEAETLKKENEQLKNRSEEVENKLSNMKKNLEALEQEKKKLAEALEKSGADKPSLDAKTKELEAKIKELEADLEGKDLEAALRKVSALINEMNVFVKKEPEAKDSTSIIQDEVEALSKSKSVQEVESKHKEFSEAFDRVRRKFEKQKLQSQLSEIASGLKQIKEDLCPELEDEAAALEKDVQACKVNKDHDLEQVRATVTDLRQKLSALQAKNEALNRVLHKEISRLLLKAKESAKDDVAMQDVELLKSPSKGELLKLEEEFYNVLEKSYIQKEALEIELNRLKKEDDGATLRQLNKDIEGMESEMKRFSEEREMAGKELMALQKDLSGLKNRIAESKKDEAQIASFVKEMEKLGKRWSVLENDTLQKEISSLKERFAKLQKDEGERFQKFEEAVERLQKKPSFADKDKLEHELDCLIHKCKGKKEGEYVMSTNHLRKMEQKLKSMSDEKDAEANRLATKMEQCHKLKVEDLAKLRKALDELEDEFERLSSKRGVVTEPGNAVDKEVFNPFVVFCKDIIEGKRLSWVGEKGAKDLKTHVTSLNNALNDEKQSEGKSERLKKSMERILDLISQSEHDIPVKDTEESKRLEGVLGNNQSFSGSGFMSWKLWAVFMIICILRIFVAPMIAIKRE